MKKYCLIIGILILMLYTIPVNGKDLNLSATASALATKDSYVHSNNPTSNYGGADWIIFGDYLSTWITEAYIEFDISSPPTGWTKAEIEIDMYSISETTQLTISEITESWGELTITWMNKPAHGQEITTLTVAVEQVYTIDVTNFISGNSLSICINATSIPTGYAQATSTEGDWANGPGPTLVWTYTTPSNGEEEEQQTLFSPIITGYNVVLLLISLIGIGIILTKKKLS
ncbi:MAG: DNRLRE domain-containing protein [Promethearchaeota archaeon]